MKVVNKVVISLVLFFSVFCKQSSAKTFTNCELAQLFTDNFPAE